VLLIGASCAGAQSWPQWRGPQACGLAPEKKLPAEWGQDKNIAWKVALPGKGWSQPIVWGNRIFVTTAITENQTTPKAGNFNALVTADRPTSSGARLPIGPGGAFGPPPPPPDKVYQWKLICLDGATGNILWEKTAREGKPRATVNQNNTYASETPAADGEHVIAYFGNTGLYCYDVSLKEGETSNAFVAWSSPLMTCRVASPLLYEGCLYLLEQQRGQIHCYDAKTGQEHYSQRLEGTKGFTSSPWGNDGKVFCLDETGVTVVLKAGPKFEVLATNKLDEMFWSSVAVMDEKLLLRSVDHLYCITP
jgi:outer membrane protein assembly factor BamB